MSNITKRQKSRRRLAAVSFLSNISLDGTHRDTKIGVYNLSLQTDPGKYDSTEIASKNNIIPDSSPKNTLLYRPKNENFQLNQRAAVSEEKLYLPSTRERVHSFINEARLKPLNQKKKVVTCNSAESIGVCNKQSSIRIQDGSSVKYLKKPLNLHNERLILLSPSKTPFAIFSALSFSKSPAHISLRSDLKQDASRRRPISGNRPLSAINDEQDVSDPGSLLGIKQPEDGQDVSYSYLLSSGGNFVTKKCKLPQEIDHLCVPCTHMSRCHSFDPSVSNVYAFTKQATTPPHERGLEWSDVKLCRHVCCLSYTPNLLDDPELIAGKHSTVLTFSSYITSIIDYVKPSDLKKELNEKFKERFPSVHLTLSKLRSLKKEMLKITHYECGIDLLTVAQAYVFFEKLILKMLISKQNRKLCAAACVLLSAKLNDVKGQDLKALIEKLEGGFRLNRKDLFKYEFGVLVALEFSLHLPTWEVFPHYQRLLYES